VTAAAAAAAVLSAAAFILRCTVLAPATGRHAETSTRRGWEGRLGELHALTLTAGRHAQTSNTCGDRNPWDNTITYNLPAHHGGNRHERRLPNGDIQAWTDNCHFDGDDCGPYAHTPPAA
jgi:hypothetical protein